ncbi:DUF3891 family protein [Zobellia nedashkovskayae]|uniref:DUF3891 family protein n=1 Tax=Zobellia nedashkovskayae TaxID=2779510 RepID=UPI00188A5CBD|nr:DUF3891 family protein [Zobellia nedashkovskayae]
MLINFLHDGVEVISHPAHGLLAGKIADKIRHKLFVDHWLETMTAIIEHDDEQISHKAKKSISKIGMPMDFAINTTPIAKSFEHAKAVFEKVNKKSSWSALILSHHLQFLYEDTAKDHAEFNIFLNDLKSFRATVCERYKVKPDKIAELYKIMIFADRLSLILCQDQVPQLGRELEINTSIDNKKYFIYESAKGNLIVKPWPFKESSFDLSLESRLLSEIKFKDEDEFDAFLAKAPIKIKSWTFSRE